MLGGYSGKFSRRQFEIQIPRGNWESKRSWRVHFSDFQRA